MEGFLLNPTEIANDIHSAVVKGGNHAALFLDVHVRPDDIGSMMVHDPVDRAVVYFVGDRASAQRVWDAAQEEANVRHTG